MTQPPPYPDLRTRKSKFVKAGLFIKNARLGLLLLLLTASVARPAAAAEIPSSLVSQLQQLYQTYQPLSSEATPGRWEDLEVMVAAAVMQARGRADQARQLQLYLKTYFKTSSLLPLLNLKPNAGLNLQLFEPDPLFSRLVKDSYNYFRQHPRPGQGGYFQELAALVPLFWQRDPGVKRSGLEAFLTRTPRSLFSGFAAYALAWQDFQDQQGSTESFYHVWQQDRTHPAARESYEAMEVAYFSPQQLSLASALLPGWGEEQLEPGMQEAAGQMYYELLFWAGAIGFTLAGQEQARSENLTAALIFANLLLQNHQASARRAWVMANRRNQSDEKRFIEDHFKNNLLAEGEFTPWSPVALKPEPPHQHLIVSPFLQIHSLADAFDRHGWIQDSSLVNAGISLGYQWDLIHQQTVPYAVIVGLRPQVDLYFNPLLRDPGEERIKDNGWQSDQTARVQVVLTQAWHITTTDSLYFSIMAGPAFCWQRLSLADLDYQHQAALAGAGISLGYGGPGGHYWALGLTADDAFQTQTATLLGKTLALPPLTWRVAFEFDILF